MEPRRASFWRRHRWLTRLAVACLVVVVGLGTALAIIAARLEPILRASLVSGLQQKFHTKVELDQFHVALGNGLNGDWGIWATGKGLRIWPPRNGDATLENSQQTDPLISLEEFRFHVPLHYEIGKPVRISRVRMEGLRLVVPPRSKRNRSSSIEPATTNEKREPAHAQARGQSASGVLSNVVVERIDCQRAQLILQTDKPDKLPLGFDIARLELRGVTAQSPMKYEAELTNPKPRGLIHASGTLGPWLADDPGDTAVSGAYTFDHADLATFKGIAGILASTGKYAGTLRELSVDGSADVPDFRLPQFGNAMALRTTFHATVDGTNGDTWLDPVDATLGHSHFTTRGQVVRVKPPDQGGNQPVTTANLPPLADVGHNIDLKVDIDHGRIEDFLRLASKSQTPFLTGALETKATLHIPPGTAPAHQRMRLDGEFQLDDARFTDVKVQGKIETLSLRGQGRPQDIKNVDANSVTSKMEGKFHMAAGVITLPEIRYQVPGADVDLQGHYALEGLMHFEGTARLQATVSQMVGGWKGMLLKPADRFFKKDGAGTEVPILIRGPHDAPEFSVDFGRMKKSAPETAGGKSGNRE